MYAEDILRLYFTGGSGGIRAEVYSYGLSSAKMGYVDFDTLKKVLDKIANSAEEKKILLHEFIRGFSDGFA